MKKGWKFTWKGEEVILRDVADKVLWWIQKFRDIGDILVQYDPVHSAIPWAGVRFILQVRNISNYLLDSQNYIYTHLD